MTIEQCAVASALVGLLVFAMHEIRRAFRAHSMKGD
jgi:hypothetical protein